MKKGYIMIFAIMLSISALAQKQNLSPELLWELDRVSGACLSPDGSQILYGISSYSIEENNGDRNLFIIPTEGGKAVQITNAIGSEFNAIWRPDGQKIAYLAVYEGSVQMWEINIDGTDNKVVSDIEGGINGFSYSPDASKIIYIKDVKVEEDLHDLYPDLPLSNALVYDDLMYRHWDTWHDYTYSHIFLADYKKDAQVKLSKGIDVMEGEAFNSPMKPWGGMEQIIWSPDSKSFVYTCKKKTGVDYTVSTNSDLFQYDIASKETKNLSFGISGYDQNPVFSPDGSAIIWEAMITDGFESDKSRLLYYDFELDERQELTVKLDISVANLVWSEDAKTVYFIAGKNATYQIFSIGVKNKKLKQITEGVHNYTSLQLAGDYLVAERMSMSMPTEIYKVKINSGDDTQLTFTNKDLLSTIQMGDVEERWMPTSDGKQMLVWIIYPPNFDPAKKYPALLYCQGGPQSAVSQFFSYRWNFQMMAANDYIVVAPNRRGLPSFGQEWNDQISQDYGGQNMRDYLTAIDTMAKEDFVDENRIGAVGASYGGFSVYWLAGNHNKRFKTFIAHCGMFNFTSWYGSTEEQWFANHDLGGAYFEDETPKSYSFSPHNFVGNWDTPILVIHGGKDFRIPYTEGMQAFNCAQLQGIPSRFLFFPEESHFVLQPQNAILWQREYFRWLDKWLKGETSYNSSYLGSGSSVSSPPVYIYKTKADYSAYVPVCLDENGKITSFPGVLDIRTSDQTGLTNGYTLDNIGICENTAFLTVTLEEYKNLDTQPTVEELQSQILDSDPFLELYYCGSKADFGDNIVDELNRVIRQGRIMRYRRIK